MREILYFLLANPVAGWSAVARGTYFRLISSVARDNDDNETNHEQAFCVVVVVVGGGVVNIVFGVDAHSH